MALIKGDKLDPFKFKANKLVPTKPEITGVTVASATATTGSVPRNAAGTLRTRRTNTERSQALAGSKVSVPLTLQLIEILSVLSSRPLRLA